MIKQLKKILNTNSHSSLVFSHDDPFVKNYIKDPELTWLISFPRTGSHWLRMIMEYYFEKPSLVLIYKYKNVKDFLCYHWHDPDLQTVGKKNVIYLYRNPVDTIYSFLNYKGENLNDQSVVEYWAGKYGKHLSKWLFEEDFTENKTIISYDLMQKNIYPEFKKIVEHFNTSYSSEKLEKVLQIIDKDKIKKKTKHDHRVINTTNQYTDLRDSFKENYSKVIMDTVSGINSEILTMLG